MWGTNCRQTHYNLKKRTQNVSGIDRYERRYKANRRDRVEKPDLANNESKIVGKHRTQM